MEQQHFARALANPDKAIRDKTVRELKKFLASVTSFENEEMLKLWKALFYCLWLSDKAPIQEDLCNSIASMLEVFQKPSLTYGKYLRMFFRIMLMEWDQLDQHRLNKFYTLIRIMLRKTFELLHSVQWAEKTVLRFLEAISVEVLMDGKRPNGPRYHLCDIYLTELWNATDGQISHDHFMVAISPFFSSLGTTTDPVFRTRLSEKVFQDFLDTHARENRQTSDFDLKLFDQVSTLCLQREIFDIASHESEDICLDKNRRKVYDLHGAFGRFSHVKNVDDEACEADLESITEVVDMNGNVHSTKKETKKDKNKNKKEKKEVVSAVVQEDVMEVEEEEEDKKKKKKEKKEKKEKKTDRKRSREENEVEVEVQVEAAPRTPQTPATPAPALASPAPFLASKKYTGSQPGYSFQRVRERERER